MTGERTSGLWPRGLVAALTGCALAAGAAAGPAGAHRPRPSAEGLWRAYPLEQSPAPTSAAQPPPRRLRPAEASHDSSPRAIAHDSSPRAIAVVGGVAVGVLAAGGGFALLRLRRRRPAPALRAPLPTPRAPDALPPRAPAPLGHGLSAAGTCWIVCWRGAGQAVFYAIARDSEGHQQLIGESPPFATTSNEPLVLDAAAFESLQSLTTRLSQGGWEAAAPVGDRGAVWRAQEFRRKGVAAELRR